MRDLVFGFFAFLTTAVAPLLGADAGIVTIVEGPGRLLRGPTWFTLAEGGRVHEGDVVDLGGRSRAQVELADGALVSLSGPATLYLASIPSHDGKPAGSTELFLEGGWLKLAAGTARGGLLLRTPLDTVSLADAVAVLRAEAGADAVFVERGAAQLAGLDRGAPPGASRDARGGEFWTRAAGKPFTSEPRPSPSFLSGMPPQFMDPLPVRAAKMRESRVDLAVAREVSYAEARPWLSGPYRKTFLKRLRPRLSDPAFRAAVETDIRAYPEWDRILHPERYLPKGEGEKR